MTLTKSSSREYVRGVVQIGRGHIESDGWIRGDMQGGRRILRWQPERLRRSWFVSVGQLSGEKRSRVE